MSRLNTLFGFSKKPLASAKMLGISTGIVPHEQSFTGDCEDYTFDAVNEASDLGKA